MASDPDQFRVSPTTGSMPLRDAPTMQNAAPEQLQRAGGAIQQAGGQAAAIYTDMLQMANQAKIDDAANKLKEAELDMTFGDKGYTKLKGENALFRPEGKQLDDEYGSNFEKYASEIEAGLSNAAQRQQFRRIANGMSTQFKGRIQAHTDGEFQTYQVGVLDGTVENRTREMVLGAGDPERTAAAEMSIRAAVYRKAQLTGNNSGEAIERLTREALTPGHVGAIKRFLDKNDPSAAERYLDMHRDMITEQGLLAVDAAVGEAQDMQIATERASAILAGGYTTAAAGAPEDVIMPVRGGVGHAFGEVRGDRLHKGIDISVPAGTTVSAPISGTVRRKEDPKGYGHYYIITSPDGKTEARVAHLSEFGVEDGAQIRKGQVIGKSGGAKGAPGAGNSSGAHVHYELRINGEPVDPTGQHRTTGSTSGQPSLVDMLSAVRSDPALMNSPKRMQEAERQIRSMYTAQKESEAQAEQDATDAAYSALAEAGGDWSKVPATIRAAVPGRARPGLKNFADDLKAPAADSDPDLEEYGRLRTGVYNGTIRRVEDIAPSIPRIGRGLAKQLIDEITGISTGKQEVIDSAKTAKEALAFIEPQLKVLGIGDGKNEDLRELNKFRGALLDKIARAERAKGGALTLQEANEIGSSLLGNAMSKNAWVKNTRGYQVPGNEAILPYRAIPPAAAAAIEESLRRRGLPATNDAVKREYHRATQAIGTR